MFGGVFFYRDGEIIDPSIPTDVAPPRHMLVTGVGRGGTTAAACMMEALGFQAEEASFYRESLHLRRFILEGDGAGAANHLRGWSAGEHRMFWKDPKIWIPSFDPFLDLVPPDIGTLVIVRDPLNIAARNAALRSVDLANEVVRAAKATVKLVARLPLLTRGHAIVVSYEKLMLHTAEVVQAIAGYLGVTSADAIALAIKSIEPTPDFYQDKFQEHMDKPALSTPVASDVPADPAPAAVVAAQDTVAPSSDSSTTDHNEDVAVEAGDGKAAADDAMSVSAAPAPAADADIVPADGGDGANAVEPAETEVSERQGRPAKAANGLKEPQPGRRAKLRQKRN